MALRQKHSRIDGKNCFQMRDILSQSHQTLCCQVLTWWSSSLSPGCSQGVNELLPIATQRRTGSCAVMDRYPQIWSTWEAPVLSTVTQRWASWKFRMAVDLSVVAAGSVRPQEEMQRRRDMRTSPASQILCCHEAAHFTFLTLVRFIHMQRSHLITPVG